MTPWPFAWWLLAPASLTDDVGHHDLWHQDLSPDQPSTPLTFHPTDPWPLTFDTTIFDTIIFDLNDLRPSTFHFWPVSFEPCLLFWTDPRLFITNISHLNSWPLISKFWPVTPWPFAGWLLAPASLTDDVGHHDLWHQDLSPDQPSTPLTFHPTYLRPLTFDTAIFDTIIFDLNDLRPTTFHFCPVSFEPCLLFWTDPRLFITNISPLNSWPFISKFWHVTPWPFAWWPLAPASLTDDVGHHDLWHQDLSPDQPLTPLTFHPTDLRLLTFDTTIFDTIIFDLNDLRPSTFHFWPVSFEPCLLFWTDPRLFITNISPLNSWPFISKFWPVTPWPFAGWPLAPASLTDDVGHHDLWHQDLSPDQPSTPLTFHPTDLWPLTFDTTIFDTIIFDLNDLRPSTFHFWPVSFEPCLLFWTDPRIFITNISPWIPGLLFPSSDLWPHDLLPDDLWHQHLWPMMLDTMTYDTKIFHLTNLRFHWPFTLLTFDPWPLTLRFLTP